MYLFKSPHTPSIAMTDVAAMNETPLLLMNVALRSPDPSSWACITPTAHSALKHEAFELEWFLQWHPVLLPHRPWQYAVLTWRRMAGASPGHIARFMLRVLQAKQQQRLQQQQQQQPQQLAKQHQQQPQKGTQRQQQSAQAAALQPAPVSVATRERYAVERSVEGQFSGLYPDLQPLPSTLRKVHKLLARHEAAADMQALLLLCPCPTLLLCQYAARSGTTAVEADLCLRKDTSSTTSSNSSSGCDGNSAQTPAMPLLQRLMQHMGASGSRHGYWSSIYSYGNISSSDIMCRTVYTSRQGCQAALAAGHIPSLLWALPSAMRDTRRGTSKPRLLTVLLPYAARYSNAACLRAVLMQFSPFDRAAVLAPQHLAMAAGRTDPWALGVVQLIMRLLAPKQLKPSHMRAAYTAACSSGYLPILQEFVHHAAAAPQWHLPVLVQAAADSRNMLVAQLLLGDVAAAQAALQARHSPASSIQQQPTEEDNNQQQQQQHLPAAAADHSTDTAGLPVRMQQQLTGDSASCTLSSPMAAAAMPKDPAAGLSFRRQQPSGVGHSQGHEQKQQQQPSLAAAAAPRDPTDTADSAALTASIQQLHAAWASFSPLACIKLLQYFLPSLSYMSSLEVLVRHDLEAVPLYVLERLWRLLPTHRQSELRAACLNGRTRAAIPKDGTPEERAQYPQRRLELWAYAALQRQKQAASYAWLLKHQLLPARIVDEDSRWDLMEACCKAREAGIGVHAQRVAHLQRFRVVLSERVAAQQSAGGGQGGSGYSFQDVFTTREVIQGRLAAACAACDGAAIAQLELCYQLCYLLQTPPPLSPVVLPARPATTVVTAPTLPVSLQSGRLVTAAHLAAGLGLPWPLLGTLLAAAGFDKLGYVVPTAAAVSTGDGAGAGSSSGSTQQQLWGSSSIEQQLEHARFALQDPHAAMEQGVLRVDCRPHQSMLMLPAFVQEGFVLAHQLTNHLAAYGHDMLLPHGALSSVSARICNDKHPELLLSCIQDQQSAHRILMQLGGAFEGDLQELLNGQQEQTGPPPLWLQCLLQHTANAIEPPTNPPTAHFDGRFLLSIREGSGLCHGLQAGRSAQEVQVFISTVLLQHPPHTPAPAAMPYTGWGPCILRNALLHRAPSLLAWSLQPEQQQQLWGREPDAVAQAVAGLLNEEGCSPISCRFVKSCRLACRCWPNGIWAAYHLQRQVQQQDLLHMLQGRDKLLGVGSSSSSSCGPMVAAAGPLPQFAADAVQLAMAILQHPGMPADTLNNWLQRTLGVDSTLPDIVRARTIVASVAASEVIPVGAGVCRKEAVRQVLAVGDPDLWSAVLLWCHRLPRRDEEVEAGVPVDNNFFGADPALLAAAVAQLAAGIGAVNI